MRDFWTMALMLCCCCWTTFEPSMAAEPTLRMVHVFFRHGSRTPELKHTYPTDPYGEETFAAWGYGQLTNAGKLSSYKLGQNLRSRYSELLGSIYTPGLVRATSTDFDRTKMTLLLVLAGLFPPEVSQIWNEEVLWQPIPYHYDKADKDFFLRRPLLYCPRYRDELDQVLESVDVQRELKAHRKLLQYIAKHTKKPATELMDAFAIYQTLNAEESMNLTLPEWTGSIYPDAVHSLASRQMHYENSNDVLKKLNGGRSLQKVIKNMVDRSTVSQPDELPKMLLYSGHENNVLNVLAAMDLFGVPHVPKYNSAVMIELHHVDKESGGVWAVKVYYSRSVDSAPEPQELTGCEDILCPLDRFIQVTSHHVPVNYTLECQSDVELD